MTVGPAQGHYPGAPTSVGYRLEMVDLTQPGQVTLNGRGLSRRTPGSDAPGWYYQAATATVVVNTPELPTARALAVVASGATAINRPEPPAPASALGS